MKTTKKIVSFFLAVIMIMSMFSVAMTAFAATKKVTKIALNKTTATLYTNQKLTLTAKVSPSNASNKKVTWSTSSKSIATVSSKGVVTPKKAGTVTITAKAADGSGKKASCKVTVKKFVKISSLKISATTKSINVGSSAKLSVTVSPSNATTKTLKWTSSNTKVATVDSKGSVKGVKAGTATITAAATDGSGKKVTCKVTVKNVKVSGITLSKTAVTLYPAKTVTLKATVAPSNATVPAVKWTSSDTTAATVDSNGVVKGVKAGKTAVITCAATDGSGKKATCTVTVGTYVKSMTITSSTDPDSSWYVGKTGKLTANITPSNATNKKVTWASSDSSYATVDANGNVKILKIKKNILNREVETSVTITATAADGNGAKATYTVKIVPEKKPESIAFNAAPETIYITGASRTVPFTATISPADATERGIKYSSSNTAVAKIDANGNVTALKAGTAVITATSAVNSAIKVTKTIKVENVTIEASISAQKKFYAVGNTAIFETLITPTEATSELGLTFESSNEKVVTATPYKSVPKARLDFVGIGKAKVRAVSADGKAVSNWVEVEVRELRLDKDFFDNVKAGDTLYVDAYLFNGSRVTPAADGDADDVQLYPGKYASYFEIAKENGKFRIFVKYDLPDDGAYITVRPISNTAISAKISLTGKKFTTPSGDKSALYKVFSEYAKATKSEMSTATYNRTVRYSDVAVDNKNSNMSMKVNGMSLDAFIGAFGSSSSGDDLDELSAESMIKDVYSGENKETPVVIDASKYPAAPTVALSDVKEVKVIDNGRATYQLKLTLNDQTQAMALADVQNSPYSKTMRVLDKAYLDEYSKELNDIGAEQFGMAGATVTLKYGTVNEKYSDTYVLLTIDKRTDAVETSEYHYKTNIDVKNADFNMAATIPLSDDIRIPGLTELKLNIGLKAYFNMNVESTTVYTNITK